MPDIEPTREVGENPNAGGSADLTVSLDDMTQFQSLNGTETNTTVFDGDGNLDFTNTEDIYGNSDNDSGQLKSWNMDEQAVGIFDRFDADNDQRLNTNELATAVKDGNVTGKDAQLVAALYEHRDSIGDLVDDDGDGMSMEDIKQAGLKAASESTTGLLNYWNMSDREPITPQKVQQSLSDPELPQHHRKGLELLKDQFGEMANEDGTVTAKEILAFMDQMPQASGNDMYNINGTMQRTHESEVDSDGKLYSNADNPLESIVPEGVEQGELGNCDFLSGLASLAEQRPEAIRDMIQRNDDGTYTVTFPDQDPVTVTEPTPAEMGLYAKGTEHGHWAAVIEKARGQFQGEHFWRRSWRNPLEGDTVHENSEGGENQFTLGNSLEFLTGSDTDTDMFQLQMANFEIPLGINGMENTGRKLTEAMNNNDTVIARKDNHVGAVRGFNPAGPDGGTITIYDQDNKQYDVSLKEFVETYHSVTYEDRS